MVIQHVRCDLTKDFIDSSEYKQNLSVVRPV